MIYMKNMVRIFFLSISALLFTFQFMACDDGGGGTPSKTELLTQPTWRLVSLTVNGGSQPVSGYNIRFTSTTEGSGNYTASGALLTIPNSGTWAFNTSETVVVLNGGPAGFRIVRLEQDEMVLELTQQNYKNGDVLLRFEFGK